MLHAIACGCCATMVRLAYHTVVWHANRTVDGHLTPYGGGVSRGVPGARSVPTRKNRKIDLSRLGELLNTQKNVHFFAPRGVRGGTPGEGGSGGVSPPTQGFGGVWGFGGFWGGLGGLAIFQFKIRLEKGGPGGIWPILAILAVSLSYTMVWPGGRFWPFLGVPGGSRGGPGGGTPGGPPGGPPGRPPGPGPGGPRAGPGAPWDGSRGAAGGGHPGMTAESVPRLGS